MHCFEWCQSTKSIWEEPECGTFFGTTFEEYATTNEMDFMGSVTMSPASGRQQAASDNTEVEEHCTTNEPVPNSVHLQPSQVPGTSYAVERDTTT